MLCKYTAGCWSTLSEFLTALPNDDTNLRTKAKLQEVCASLGSAHGGGFLAELLRKARPEICNNITQLVKAIPGDHHMIDVNKSSVATWPISDLIGSVVNVGIAPPPSAQAKPATLTLHKAVTATVIDAKIEKDEVRVLTLRTSDVDDLLAEDLSKLADAKLGHARLSVQSIDRVKGMATLVFRGDENDVRLGVSLVTASRIASAKRGDPNERHASVLKLGFELSKQNGSNAAGSNLCLVLSTLIGLARIVGDLPQGTFPAAQDLADATKSLCNLARDYARSGQYIADLARNATDELEIVDGAVANLPAPAARALVRCLLVQILQTNAAGEKIERISHAYNIDKSEVGVNRIRVENMLEAFRMAPNTWPTGVSSEVMCRATQYLAQQMSFKVAKQFMAIKKPTMAQCHEAIRNAHEEFIDEFRPNKGIFKGAQAMKLLAHLFRTFGVCDIAELYCQHTGVTINYEYSPITPHTVSLLHYGVHHEVAIGLDGNWHIVDEPTRRFDDIFQRCRHLLDVAASETTKALAERRKAKGGGSDKSSGGVSTTAEKRGKSDTAPTTAASPSSIGKPSYLGAASFIAPPQPRQQQRPKTPTTTMALTILDVAGVSNSRYEAARRALNGGVEARLVLAAAMSPKQCFCTFGARCHASSCTYTRGQNHGRQTLAKFHSSDFSHLQSQAKRALHIDDGGDELSFSAIVGGKNTIDKLYEIALKRRQQSTQAAPNATHQQQSQQPPQQKKLQHQQQPRQPQHPQQQQRDSSVASASSSDGNSDGDAYSSGDESRSSDSSSDTSELSSDGTDEDAFEVVKSKKAKRAQQQQQQQQRGSSSHGRGGRRASSNRSSGTNTGSTTPVGMSGHALPAGGVSTTGTLRGDISSKPPVRFEQTIPHSHSASSSRRSSSRSESPSDSPRSTTSSASVKMIDIDALAELIKGIVRDEVGRVVAPPRH